MAIDEKIMTECRYSESEGRRSHFHNAYELLYICNGQGTIYVNGRKYDVGSNTLMFFSNLEEHVAIINQLPFCRYFVKFDPDQLNHQMISFWQLSVFKNRPDGFVHYVKMDQYSEEVKSLFEMLLKEEKLKDDKYTNEMVVSILRQILIIACRCDPARFSQYSVLEQHNLAQMQRWIETHFTEDIRIKDITDKFYISPSHFSRIFKKSTGYTPKQYLMLKRIAYAKELLAYSELSVSDIAHNCGFMDESNFVRCFRRELKTTPYKYRKFLKEGK